MSGSEFEVPDESVAALFAGAESLNDRVTTHNDAVRAIATPVVAAELRRAADQAERGIPADHPWGQGVRFVATSLRARADELDGGAS